MPFLRKIINRPVFWIILAVLLFTTVLAILSIQRHYNLESDEDLAMFDQMLWNVRQGKGLCTTLSGEADLLFKHHFFGEHVSPILYLLAWPAGLTRGPEALLIIQALLIGLSAIPVSRWAGNLLKNQWAGMAAGFFWLLLPDLWLATLYDWHMEALEPLFLFAFILALQGGNKTSWLWAVLYAACKEDTPVYLAFAAIVFGWHTHRKLGLQIAIFAIGYALLAWLVIGPACSPSGQHMLVARAITPAQCHGWWPWVNNIFFDAERWTALFRHLLSFGFLPLFGGLALLPAAAAVGAAWLSISCNQFSILMHYPFTVYPLLMLGAVGGANFILNRLRPVPAKSSFSSSALSWKKIFRSIVFLAPLIGLLISWPLSLNDIKERIGTGGKDWDKTDAAIAGLPNDGLWAGTLQLVSHFARRDKVTIMMAPMDADWLVVRLHGRVHTFPEYIYRRLLVRLLSSGSNYGVYCLPNSTVAVLKRFLAPDNNSKALKELLLVMEEDDVVHSFGTTRRDPHALNGRAWSAGEDEQDFIWFGGYRNLPAGKYRAKFRLRTEAPVNAPIAKLEVVEENGKNILGEIKISGNTGGYVWQTMEVTLTGKGNAECRCFKTGAGTIMIDRVEWELTDQKLEDIARRPDFFPEK